MQGTGKDETNGRFIFKFLVILFLNFNFKLQLTGSIIDQSTLYHFKRHEKYKEILS